MMRESRVVREWLVDVRGLPWMARWPLTMYRERPEGGEVGTQTRMTA